MIQIGSETEKPETEIGFSERELVLAKTNISGLEVTIHSKGYVAYLKTKLRIWYSKTPPNVESVRVRHCNRYQIDAIVKDLEYFLQ